MYCWQISGRNGMEEKIVGGMRSREQKCEEGESEVRGEEASKDQQDSGTAR